MSENPEGFCGSIFEENCAESAPIEISNLYSGAPPPPGIEKVFREENRETQVGTLTDGRSTLFLLPGNKPTLLNCVVRTREVAEQMYVKRY